MLLAIGNNDGRVFDILQQNYYFSAEKSYFTGCAEVIHFDETRPSKTISDLKKAFMADCKTRSEQYRKDLEAATRF
jgi:hypothetical protein